MGVDLKHKYSTFDLFKYVVICTVGSGVLFGPKSFYNMAGKNPLTVNLALLVATVVVELMAQCFAELKRMIPQEGGDFLYIEEFFSSAAGTAYTVAILGISVPGVNSFFANLLLDVYGIKKNRALFSLLLCIVIAPIALIPVSGRKKVSKVISLLQQVTMVLIFASLPLSIFLASKNSLISTTKTVERTPIGANTFFLTFSNIYFIFCGFYECNGLHKDVTGNLYYPYMVSTTSLYAIYAVILNLFFYIYRNETDEIDYEKVLGFLPGKSNRAVYVILCSVLFVAPFFGNGFMQTNNANYLINKYKLKGTTIYGIIGVVSAISFGFTFIGLGMIMAILSVLLILSSTFSIMGIFVFCRRNPSYKRRIPTAAIYTALIGSITMMGTNVFYIGKNLIDKINK